MTPTRRLWRGSRAGRGTATTRAWGDADLLQAVMALLPPAVPFRALTAAKLIVAVREHDEVRRLAEFSQTAPKDAAGDS